MSGIERSAFFSSWMPFHREDWVSGKPVIGAFAIALLLSGGAEAQQQPGKLEVEVEEEIVVEGGRALTLRLNKGFDAFNAGDFAAAEHYFYSVRRNEFLKKADNFTDFLQSLSPTNGGLMSHVTMNLRTSSPWRRQAYAILYYMEGMSQLGQDKTKSANRSFRMALEMNPRHFDARADYALTHISLGKAHKAEKHIRRLAKDLRKCASNEEQDRCTAIKDRLLQVEVAYGKAVSR